MVEILGVSRVSASEAGGYAARDVVNAPDVKTAILRRSQRRNDPDEIRIWLLNHFFRYAVGNLQAPPPALRKIVSLDQAQELFAAKPVPDWLAQRLQRAAQSHALWWLDPQGAQLLACETRIVEFLGARLGGALQGKLERINCLQALATWQAEHAQFAARTAAGWREHQPAAVRVVWQGEQGQFVELLPDTPWLRAEMAYESQMMRHCLGQFEQRKALRGGYGEHYATACTEGRLRLFSFRTGHAQPKITLSAVVTAQGLRIDQIKGKQNRPPIARYRAEIMGFLNALPTCPDISADAAEMGLVWGRSGWCHVSELRDEADQLRVVHAHPALVRELPQPSVLVQWIVAARQPAYLQGLRLAPAVALALAAAQ